MTKFKELRQKYPEFIYESYDIKYDEDYLKITFNFNIPNLTKFNPTLKIENKYIKNKNINNKYLNYLVFNIGLIELISYIKCTCSPNIIIKCGHLNNEQISFFKKLYYYGLGEFLYINKINIDINSLFNIKIEGKEEKLPNINYEGSGNLIPIGGGKDSNVTLEILKSEYENNDCFVINPKAIQLDCATVGGYSDKLITVSRTLDKRLLELNDKGFLNGHTPFSSVVAFTSYLVAYLSNKKYIVLSNEGSANESTVIGTKINHQYSKTYEFENDFNNYTKKYFNIDIKYFSLLRAFNEYQIALLFANYEKYHKVFKSCNVGSKQQPWVWCNNCAKCLFVYIILSPFLYKDKLIDIFGNDLYENKDLLNTFIELLGYSDKKPFECVGTYNEVRYAVSLTINKMGDNLPYLLKYYKNNYKLELDHNLENNYNQENNIDPNFEKILKKELDKYV